VKPRGIAFGIMDSSFQWKTTKKVSHDIAGPLCFAGDYLAKNVLLPQAEETDVMILAGTGSNSYGLWSRHCSRDIPSFIAVDFDRKKVEKLSPRLEAFQNF
jgi:diaminopimelate decarboxylase